MTIDPWLFAACLMGAAVFGGLFVVRFTEMVKELADQFESGVQHRMDEIARERLKEHEG